MCNVKLREGKKCKIYGCANCSDEGLFIGDFCFPCYKYLKHGKGIYSQAYRNEKQIANLKKELSTNKYKKVKYNEQTMNADPCISCAFETRRKCRKLKDKTTGKNIYDICITEDVVFIKVYND